MSEIEIFRQLTWQAMRRDRSLTLMTQRTRVALGKSLRILGGRGLSLGQPNPSSITTSTASTWRVC
jgi:hypothetical protein